MKGTIQGGGFNIDEEDDDEEDFRDRSNTKGNNGKNLLRPEDFDTNRALKKGRKDSFGEEMKSDDMESQ
jgi:hypothetical protein